MITEAAVLQALRVVQDPDLHRDIVALGFVKNVSISGGAVSFDIELTTPACPVRERMQAEARDVVSAIPGVASVKIRMTSQVRPSPGVAKEQLIPGVRNVLPVASGKGGVGKSTVSANLALALSAMGARVGLMDADVYGPSIPTIMGVKEPPGMIGERIIPVDQYGIKVMSMGFFLRDDQAVVWRGPMLAKMVEQFLGGVEWGELDYLVIDLPPGTGDVQLTLCQRIPISGAAIVSTPQDVALRVAEKAIHMFRQLNTPVLGLIENMSYFVCGHCGERENIFDNGGARRASDRLAIPFLGEIPLASSIRVDSDAGRPTVIAAPESALSRAFFGVAENLAAQVSVTNMQQELTGSVQISF
ncbi:MAG: Mrp/NBP35 family ATP-binding protein [Acidobacteria bacterium]|nr:Mrp/NBP35 family ATP-binding protein [Acidobacteriota bacterium]